jgi:hypothetical protein
MARSDSRLARLKENSDENAAHAVREWLCCISQSQSKFCPLMTLQEASVEEDRWSPVEVLIWIATRSRRFMEALRGLPLSCVEDRLWRLQSENHSPHPLTLSTALLAFREEVERGRIRGLEWEFPRAKDGTICMFNMYEFALMDISFRAADVLRTWPDWPATLAWNAAKTRPWQAPRGISKVWIRSLPAGDYLPFADVVDLVAFGPAKVAIGLSDIVEHVAQLRAGIAIINAAIEGKIKLAGTPCERWQNQAHLSRQTGHRIAIGSETLQDLIPVPFGSRDWLGPRRYADEYAEIGHAPHSVSFCGVMVERASLLKWLTTASIKAPGLREADVTELVLSEKEKNPSVSIDKIVKLVQANDPLFSRAPIREIAREMGVEGRRGRPRKNSAE